MIDLEEQLAEHLRRRAAAVLPRLDLEAVEHGVGSVAPGYRDDGPRDSWDGEMLVRHPEVDRPTRRPLISALVGAAAATLIGVAVVATVTRDVPTTVTNPPVGTSFTRPVVEVPFTVAFIGSWTSIDADSSAQTMEIGAAGDESVQITVHDVAATVCSGASSSMTGTGRLDSRGDLVIESPLFTCDDGSEPLVLSPPIEEQLRNLTLAHDPRSDTLTDNLGIVWSRSGVEVPGPASPISDVMWPQSSLDEVREAQALADAGDPAYAWQVDSQLASAESWSYLRQRGGGPQLVERFLREQLGWEDFLFNAYQGDDGDGAADGVHRGLVYLRCAPGETNDLYPIGSDNQQEAPGAELCAPTIDELRYETVHLDLAQLDQRGPAGIWVVSRWTQAAPFTQTDPRVAETEATARMENFLRARVDGQGAGGYVELAGETFAVLDDVPLLYATSAGARYERYEIERVSGPSWPFGWMEFKARLFADGGVTVVEQSISLLSDGDGQLTLFLRVAETTENGQPVAMPYGFFDGEVTALAPDPWKISPWFASALTLNGQSGDERLELVANPFPVATGCGRGPAASDASALAASIRSDPDLQVTAPVAVSVGGVEGLAMDVTVAAGASVCDLIPSTQVLTQNDSHKGPVPPGVNLDQGSRMRLFLLDLPEGATTRILAIAVVAPEASFDAVVESATPIIDSIEFHTG